MLNPSIKGHGLSSKVKLLTVLSALCLLLPLGALQLSAQNHSGTFVGTIYDPSGAAVPNATVIMNNDKANTTDMTTSDASGNFKFVSLPVGEYDMKVLKQGFQKFKAPRVGLERGRDSSRTVTLKVGSITEDVDVMAEGTAKPQSGRTAGDSVPISVGGNIEPPRLLNKVQPTYPAAAKSMGIEGTVVLRAIIGMDGSPLSLRVVNTQVDHELERAAIEAVSKWRYSPTLLNGKPIEVDTTVNVNFKLLP